MKNTNCPWLPKTVSLADFGGDYPTYFNYLFDVYDKELWHNGTIFYKGLPVGTRTYPDHHGRPDGFYHLTHYDGYKSGYHSRIPDLHRSERLHWIPHVIKHYDCSSGCCNGLITWQEDKGRTEFIFFPDERYIVILELRKGYYVIKTAYFIEKDHRVKKILNQYERAKGAKQ